MKNLTLSLCLCVLIMLQACKKDNENSQPHISEPDIYKPITLPADPTEGTPTSGTPLPDEPASSIVHRAVNLPLAYNKHVYLDVNADGVSDFNFVSVLIQHDDRPYLYLMVTPKNVNGARVMVQTGAEQVINALYTYPFEKDAVIAETPVANCVWTEPLMKGFIMASSKTAAQQTFNGLWNNKKDKYLGIKLKINGALHYGWVKLSHDRDKDEITITDYAYSTVSGQSIPAGKIN